MRGRCIGVACAVLCCLGCGDSPTIEFKAKGKYFSVHNGDGFEPIYINGVNLGTGIPGHEPGELVVDYDSYLRWFERMGELGINVVRVYTLHYPRFYEAFFAYNNLHPDRPLYLIQNIWLDESNPTGGLDIFDFSRDIDQAVVEVVNAIHGDAEIPHRLGRAFGSYTVDTSPWVLGWVLGRPTQGAELVVGNQKHSELSAFSGSALSIENTTPSQVWATERLDGLISHERDRFRSQRPVAISNWPITDPLQHPSQRHPYDGTSLPENFWDVGDDDVVMELQSVDQSKAPAGLFASYHVYPYYPDFIYRDEAYSEATDAEGPNNYAGYLNDLKGYYTDMPLLVSEFGVPSSWGRARDSPVAGFHYGGHDEEAQGAITVRMAQNVFDSGCAGGVVTSWMDEWWKQTWIVTNRTYPTPRLPLWMDTTSAEANYGLLSFEAAAPRYERWSAATGLGRIRSVKADVDVRHFHLRIDLSAPLADGEVLTIGYDTYSDELGDSQLPGSIAHGARSEIALVVTAPDSAQVYVTQAYDLYGTRIGQRTAPQVSKSVASDGDPWNKWRWITNVETWSDDGSMHFPQKDYNLGAVRVRGVGAAPTSLDAVVLGDTVEVHIPWVLLQYSDPSSLEVIHDDLETEHRIESEKSEGIAVSVALGGELVETPRWKWDGWDEAPATEEREKPVMAAYEAFIANLPKLTE